MRPAGRDAFAHIFPGGGQDRYILQPYLRAHAAGGCHIPQVAEKAEPGHVRQRMCADRGDDFRRLTVECGHEFCCFTNGAEFVLTELRGGDDDPYAERLGQDQKISRLCPGIRHHALRVNRPNHRKPVDRLFGLDGMTADNVDPGFVRFRRRAAQDFAQHGRRQRIFREPDQVQCGQRPPAHRVNIAQRIGRGHRAEIVRMIHDRREKIRGQHQAQVRHSTCRRRRHRQWRCPRVRSGQ